jgi:glycosyltransferase involved in cell wall biosynthesis
LVILGRGNKKKELKSLAERYGVRDEVRFPGFVDNPYKYMKHADVFALSSKREGLPTVLIEAMACGTPVVSTDCPSGPAEILEHGKWGHLVPVGEPDKLCVAIDNTLDDPTNGKPRSVDFRLENAVESYLKVLDLPCVN